MVLNPSIALFHTSFIEADKIAAQLNVDSSVYPRTEGETEGSCRDKLLRARDSRVTASLDIGDR